MLSLKQLLFFVLLVLLWDLTVSELLSATTGDTFLILDTDMAAGELYRIHTPAPNGEQWNTFTLCHGYTFFRNKSWGITHRHRRRRRPRRRNLSVCEQLCTRNSCPLGQLCFPATKCRGKQCTCPRGVTLFHCLVSPCMFAKCPEFPDAQCVADYCGGCKARFFKRNQGSNTRGCEVTERCKSSGDADDSDGSGVPDCNINCFVFPCDERIASCPAFPQAVCRAQCNCTAKFFITEDGEERDVTSQCTAK